MKRVRLHAKFLVLLLGSLALLLVFLSYALVNREAALLAKKEAEKQHVLASAVYADLKESMMEGMPRSTLKLMDSLRGTYGLVRLETVRKDGSAAFGINRRIIDVPQLAPAFRSGKELSFREKGPPELHTILYPLRNERECRGCHRQQEPILGVLIISLSMEDSLREIASSKRQLTLFLAALILLVGSVLYVLVRSLVLRPLVTLYHGAERIGSGELSHRVRLSTGDEIQELADRLNVMAGHLEESYAGLEQRIRERTAEAENKARQLYEYSRDLAAISRLSTKVFNAGMPLDDLLDHFQRAVMRGLGYRHSMLCLVDRTRAWLDIQRDSGLGSLLGIQSCALSSPDPFAETVRTGGELVLGDEAVDRLFPKKQTDARIDDLFIMPIHSGSPDKRCWEVRNCIRRDCAAYHRESGKCWLLPRTLCGNELIESYGDKLAYCMTCDVFPVLGVLLAAAPTDRMAGKLNRKVLRVLAAEMGAALENHRLYEENRQMVRTLLELHKVTASSLRDLSFDQALEAFTDSAVKLRGLDACNFWLVSPDQRSLIHKTGGCPGPAPDQDFCPPELPVETGILGRAFREQAVVTEYHALYQDPTALGAATAARSLPALLAIPLKTESRVIGVFSVHKKSTTPFPDSEIAAFMLLANHAALVVSVCRLNEELMAQNRELARSTSLMRGILSSMSSGVMLVGGNGSIELINQAGAALLGFSPDEMMNRRLTDLVPDAAAFLTSPAGPYQEAEITDRSGTGIPLGYSSALCHGESGRSEGLIVVYRDLTEIKALQAAVVQKERFSAMGQVVAGVAHEIRNPLFGISSIGQIFERELKAPAHLDLVRALLSETNRLKQLVEELLIYGRPIKLAIAECDLTALWEEVIGMHREELIQKGIVLQGDLGRARIRARLDPHQVRQVFLNLLRNAADATGPGGRITIKLLLEDAYIIVQVIDTGSGIPAADLGRAFELFYTTKPKGTGLGLAICKKIVEDHGGAIALASRSDEEPRGTTVSVKLPYRSVREPQQA